MLNEPSKEQRKISTILVHWANLWNMKSPRTLTSKITLDGILGAMQYYKVAQNDLTLILSFDLYKPLT